MGNGTRTCERGGDARARLHEEVRQRRRLRARRDRAGVRLVTRLGGLGGLALVVVASCSMMPKTLRASTPRNSAPAVAPAETHALPFMLGDVRQRLSAKLLATAPHLAPPEYATAWKY
jgi:hypothetical protein